MNGPEGNSEFRFLRISMFPETRPFAGNSLFVRCHMSMNQPMNAHVVLRKTPAI